ncbi:hypothetical protein [Bacillus sp. 22-7]
MNFPKKQRRPKEASF